jgi:SAM-dependent methyltransferase
MNCPLCDSDESDRAWLGRTVYRAKVFDYRECVRCGSLYVSPMPDEDDLAQMYGEDYGQFLDVETAHSGNDGSRRVLDHLATLKPGNFLDYGCGAGSLLRSVSELGWKCFGVDFDRSNTTRIREKQEIEVAGDLSDIDDAICFDVVHFGDVLEHLTDVNTQIPPILARLSTGGAMIAQGPLEANANLFLYGLRLKRLLRPTDSTMPPYHVSLATARGQRTFFERFGLTETDFSVFETAHPAPDRLTAAELKSPRLTALWAMRAVSQTVSHVSPGMMGNRYFYIGHKRG